MPCNPLCMLYACSRLKLFHFSFMLLPFLSSEAQMKALHVFGRLERAEQQRADSGETVHAVTMRQFY